MHSYNSSSSYTCEPFNPEKSWSIQYGKGAASGYLVHDTVSIGGQLVSSQVFAAATSWEEDLISCSEPMDGILGFAMKKASESGYNTIIENLYEQGKIGEKVFSLRLSGDGTSSLMVIGEPDPQYYVDEIVYSDVVQADQTGMWFIEFVGLLYTENNATTLSESNGVWVDTCEDSNPCLALIDSGTSYITMPSNEYNTLVNYISSTANECWNSYGQYICPQSSLSSLPNLWIQIDKKALILTPQDYMVEEACTNKGGYYCLAISELDQMGDHTYIFGDTFLRNYYVIFDETDSRIGFGGMNPMDNALKRPDNSTIWTYIEIGAFILGGIGIFICICVSCLKYQPPKIHKSPSESFEALGLNYRQTVNSHAFANPQRKVGDEQSLNGADHTQHLLNDRESNN